MLMGEMKVRTLHDKEILQEVCVQNLVQFYNGI